MQDLIDALADGLINAFYKIGDETFRVIPGLIGALIIILIGVVIGRIVKEIVVRLLQASKVDNWVEEHKLKAAIGNMKVSVIAGSFVKWYIIALFLAQSVALVNMEVLKAFMQNLVNWIPLALKALVVFIGGLLIARFVRNMIETAQHQYKRTVATIVEAIIIYMGIVMALNTVGINTQILLYAFVVAFSALVLVAAIVVGIAFGMAFFKDAKQIVADIRKEIGK